MCCGPLYLYVHTSDLEQRQLPFFLVTKAKMAIVEIIVGFGREGFGQLLKVQGLAPACYLGRGIAAHNSYSLLQFIFLITSGP